MITCKASSTFKITSHHPLHPIPRFLYPERRIFLHLSSSPTRSSPPAPKSHGALVHGNGSRRIIGIAEADCEKEEEGEDSADKVRYQVDVVSWRERRIKADISVNADVDSVWNVLTDYERLADFVPNLVSSRRIPCPHPGRIWLEQRGLQQALYWHIEARVVLDLREFVYSVNHRELRFSMVDGDFKKFEGKWSIKSRERSMVTVLSYEVNVIPRFDVPAILLERIIRSDLPKNLQALACRSERNYGGIQKLLITEGSLGTSSLAVHNLNGQDVDGSSIGKEKMIHGEFEENNGSPSFGPLLPSSGELNSKWGVFGKVCGLKPSMVDEVHLRRFDGLLENGGVHRCVVASITVKASVREVWNLLTAYEKLPEIVPNLAISKILSRENNRVRILQEGCKGLLYMVLHARVVLDLQEHLEREISFEQVEGDFDSFQGKWLLEQLGSHHTLLKYTVESKMHKDTFLSEAIMEEVVYEDLPSNLCAIRDYIEKKEAVNSLEYSEVTVVSSSSESDDEDSKEATTFSVQNSLISSRQRPRVPGLQRNIEVLKSELLKFISEHGLEGFMPMRKQLRLHGRIDIEKAINRNGGFRKIASMMNLSLAYKYRKPKGYWDNIGNLKEEISRFQKHWGMDPSFMPSRKTFERAGRYDIARALEKWGGLHEASQLLSLKVRHPNRNANLGRDKKVEQNTPSKAYVPQDTQKWLSTLKDLDINWVE